MVTVDNRIPNCKKIFFFDQIKRLQDNETNFRTPDIVWKTVPRTELSSMIQQISIPYSTGSYVYESSICWFGAASAIGCGRVQFSSNLWSST